MNGSAGRMRLPRAGLRDAYAEFARNSFYAWERNTPDQLLDTIYRDLDSLHRDENGSCEQNLETVARTVRWFIDADPLETNR